MSVRFALGALAREAVDRVLPRLVDERIATGLTAQDDGLWGGGAAAHPAPRLGWTEAVVRARPLVPRITALADRLRDAGADRVVLVAPPGTALAAVTIARTQAVELTTADAGDLDEVLGGDPATVVVLAEPAGSALPAGVLERAARLLTGAGTDSVSRLVVVAVAGSTLAHEAQGAGAAVLAAEPDVDDAFSALTAVVLVPVGLAGADLGELLDEAESELLDLAIDAPANNGLVLAAALAGTDPRRTHLALVADGTHLVGFGEWAAHLLATVTAGLGAGALEPVVLAAGDARPSGDDALVVRLVADADAHAARPQAVELALSGTLGELLLVWQTAAAAVAWLLGTDPFTPDAGNAGAAA